MGVHLGPYLLGYNDSPECGIYTGDARELAKAIPDESVDLIITSPPYNLGNDHHTGNFRHFQYDDDLPEHKYRQQQIEVLAEMYRIIRPGGSLLYNHKNRIKNGAAMTPYSWLLQTDWTLKQELVWFARSQNFDRCRFYPMTERVYWLSKGTETQFYNAIGHHDLFDWQTVGTGGDFTRAFPEAMVRDMLACFPSAGITVDFYGGSGTVPAVCKMLSRQYLAFEIDPATADRARARVRQTQPPLFVPEAEQAEMELTA